MPLFATSPGDSREPNSTMYVDRLFQRFEERISMESASVGINKKIPLVVFSTIAICCVSIPVRAQTFQITDQSGQVLPQAAAWYISVDFCTPFNQCSYAVDRRGGVGIGAAGAVRLDSSMHSFPCPPISRSLSPGYAVGTGANCMVTYGPEMIGHLNVKFQIMGVDYAPPGARSTVNYGSSAMQGTSTTNSQTWVSSATESVTFTLGLDFLGLAHGTLSGTAAVGYSQQIDNTSTITVGTTTSTADIVPGPLSSASGVDHDYDIVWVWLNPLVTLVVEPNTNAVLWTGYAFNNEDDTRQMEVVPLYVHWLRNPATIPANVAARLARTWDTSGNGGLTTTDYATILAADPFSSASYNPNTDSQHRFDLQGNQAFNYEPPPDGGQPITETFSVATQTTSSQGQSAQNTYSTTFTVDFNTGANFIAALGADTKISSMYTTTDKWSFTRNSSAGKTASLSITGPAVADHYTGPVAIQVWRDNVYGSFMFYPVQ
jgi:hypothetical protein